MGAHEEDPPPPWYPPLLGCPCPRPAHQDHRPSRPHRRCLQEERRLRPASPTKPDWPCVWMSRRLPAWTRAVTSARWALCTDHLPRWRCCFSGLVLGELVNLVTSSRNQPRLSATIFPKPN